MTTRHAGHDVEVQLREGSQKVKCVLAIYQKEGSGWVLEVLHLDLSKAQLPHCNMRVTSHFQRS